MSGEGSREGCSGLGCQMYAGRGLGRQVCGTCMEAQEVSVVYITTNVTFIDISAMADWVIAFEGACLFGYQGQRKFSGDRWDDDVLLQQFDDRIWLETISNTSLLVDHSKLQFGKICKIAGVSQSRNCPDVAEGMWRIYVHCIRIRSWRYWTQSHLLPLSHLGFATKKQGPFIILDDLAHGLVLEIGYWPEPLFVDCERGHDRTHKVRENANTHPAHVDDAQ